MLRRLLQRHIPHQDTLKRNRSLRFLHPIFANTSLWVLTRRSVGNAFMVGLFCAMLPIPFQMALAVCGAWLLRCNLPLSVGLVWLTNPLTMPVIFYGNYRLGSWILDTPVQSAPNHLSTHWFAAKMVDILPVLFLGSLVSAIVIGIISNIVVRLIWRWQVASSWKRRTKRRRDQRETIHRNTLT